MDYGYFGTYFFNECCAFCPLNLIMKNKNVYQPGEWLEKHIRTYYSLLRSSGDIFIRTLETSHSGMESNLHPLAESREIDVSAFLYSAMRLPDCIDRVKLIAMGQSEAVFKEGGFKDIFDWPMVTTQARRRQLLFDGKGILAAFVSSISDIDDLIPSLTAFQIEWNKMHACLSESSLADDIINEVVKADEIKDELKKAFGLSTENWDLIQKLWGDNWNEKILSIALRKMNFRVNLLASGFSDYRRAVQNWWLELVRQFEETLIEFRPLYLVSSNMHSLANILSGFAKIYHDEILNFTLENDKEGLRRRWKIIKADEDEGLQTNFLYYAMKNYLDSDKEIYKNLQKNQENTGIYRYHGSPNIDLNSNLIDLRKLAPEKFDHRLSSNNLDLLKKSRALILNIDYPLGLTAYHILSQILASASEVRGIYIMGKAGTMSGRVGDLMIPNAVHDSQSGNLFFFKNCFSVKDLINYLNDSAVFDNQKSITVRGTFLQNKEVMKAFHNDDFNGIEMEAGPYLCAIYEDLYPERYPLNKSINMTSEEVYDIGILHYASDTPYSKKESLLSKRTGYIGLESTYACTIAIMKRIFEIELKHIKKDLNEQETID